MSKSIRRVLLAATFSLAVLLTTFPVHGESGSNPRPKPRPAATEVEVIEAVILTLLGL